MVDSNDEDAKKKMKDWGDEEEMDDEKEKEKEKGEFLTMKKGKGRTEEELKKLREDEEEKRQKRIMKNKKRNDRRRAMEDKKRIISINRFHPWDGAERKLIDTNMTNRAGEAGAGRAPILEKGSGRVPIPQTGSGRAPLLSEPAHQDSPIPTSSQHTPLTTTQKPDTKTHFILMVYRKDNNFLTRDDLFTIHAEIETAEIDLLESAGTTTHDITASQRKGQGYAIYCNNLEAEKFYQSAIDNTTDLENGHEGFKSYRHDEKRPGHQIVGFVHSTHWKNRDKFHIAFCAASKGEVKPGQVTQYRPARQDPSGMVKIYLELDDEAFEWLRTRNWCSRMGGIQVPWRAPNLPGLTGIYRPDEDVHAIKAAMIASYNSINPTDLPKTQSSEATNSESISDIEHVNMGSVKSIDTAAAFGSDEEQADDADTTLRAQTPEGNLARTLDTPRKKIRRIRTESGGYMTDVSDMESKLD